MDAERFLHSYPELASDETENPSRRPNEISPALKDHLDDATYWQETFADTIRQHLKGNGVDAAKAEEYRNAYWLWHYNTMPSLGKSVRSAIHLNPDNEQLLQELTFHHIAPGLTCEWLALSDPEYAPTAADRHEAQAWIASQSASLAYERKQIESAVRKRNPREGLENTVILEKYLTKAEKAILGNINGQLTELDMHIVLLELCKENPGLVSIVSVPQFESGIHSSRNADSILIDTHLAEAHGLQAKIAVRSREFYEFNQRGTEAAPTEKYDNNFVTLIDGLNDLGNSVVTRVPGTSTLKSVPRPGLIAMDLLAGMSFKEMPGYGLSPTYNREIMTAHGIAKELTRERKPYLHQAVNNIRDRVIDGLYREPTFAARS